MERGERTVRPELFRDVLRGQGEQLARVFDIKIDRVGAKKWGVQEGAQSTIRGVFLMVLFNM